MFKTQLKKTLRFHKITNIKTKLYIKTNIIFLSFSFSFLLYLSFF
jgi:Ca2+/Na+ antiporter